MLNYAQARRNMVDCQLRTYDVTDRAVLAAMSEVPREAFMPPGREALAYLDQPVETGTESTRRIFLAPAVLARLVQALAIEPGQRVLDVGSGLGGSAAILCALGANVTLLESDQGLSAEAARRLGALGFSPQIRVGAIQRGWKADAPFDAILINGAIEVEPSDLLSQLADGGRLACLESRGRAGSARLYVKAASGAGYRTLFDATAPVLADFARAPAFAF